MSRGGTTLYVTGFGPGTRARDLAYEFERAMAMTHPPNPNSSFLVLPRRDFAVNVTRLLPACASYVPFTSSSIERSHNDTNIVMTFFACEKFELRRIELSKMLFAFVEYESRRDADDAYHEMHNKRIGHDDLLKIEWARTPPSASWRFDSGRERERAPPGRRSPRRGGRSPSPRRGGRAGDYSPRKDSRRDRDRDYDRRDRGGDRDRSRSPDDRERDVKEERDEVRENGTNGEDRKGELQGLPYRDETKLTDTSMAVAIESPPPTHDDLDVAAE
ncbi:Pre-mRNA-splicing factor [Lachnellula hyalina]|uniref:Pre-mRNA-splicing factor n=1 Tax=Lachnellula hyalina TaxID=1316788 RepID=A0A8H8TVM9_9HELO|nr:Pre-mRNA-splicing factor [Lachnellula hyalina]TVY22405.1 Pre-mRNA-splicing factor [Lachnellula hyalina]